MVARRRDRAGLKKRKISTRISNLTEELAEIAKNREFHQRVTVSGDDELAVLESTVNVMFKMLDESQQSLRDREVLFRTLAEEASFAIIVHDENIIFVNSAAARLIGEEPEALEGRPVRDLFPSNFRDLFIEVTRRVLNEESIPGRYEIKLLDGSGQGRWHEAGSRRIDHRGEPAVLTTAFDIRNRKNLEHALLREKERAELTLESIGDGVITTDTRGRIDYMNAAAENLTGWQRGEALGRPVTEIVSLVDDSSRKSLGDPVKECLEERRRVHVGRRALLLSRSGDCEFSIELNASPISEDANTVIGVVLVMHDVTELRGLTRQMSYQASHDPLTGLLNRREFEVRLEEAVGVAHTGDSGHVLAYLDLDRFKVVNDTCGHMAGDNMLREVASLIKEKIRDTDNVARVGGDEFGLLLVGCPLEKARDIAENIVAAIRDYRFIWRDKIFNIGVSIGMVEIGVESGTVVDVLSAADSACYVAKQQGRSRVHIYSARDEVVARQRGEIHWLNRLQHAIKEDHFELYTQRIEAISNDSDNGPACEIFLRMRDEDGDISPNAFLRAAERYQLMPMIDRWVVRALFQALRNGDVSVPEGGCVSVNLSGQTLGDTQFLEYVVTSFDQTGVVPSQICFEVTETAIMTHLDLARRFVDVLQGMGCRFALDDFGSGLSSFANLKNLAMDFLKIDGSFIRSVHKDQVNHDMVAAMIKLARTLQIRVIAEQVEDRAVYDVMRRLGVDFVQGYAIERPRPLGTARN